MLSSAETVAVAGISAMVSSPSLRISSTMVAMEGGLTKEQVMAIGGWCSSAIECYHPEVTFTTHECMKGQWWVCLCQWGCDPFVPVSLWYAPVWSPMCWVGRWGWWWRAQEVRVLTRPVWVCQDLEPERYKNSWWPSGQQQSLSCGMSTHDRIGDSRGLGRHMAVRFSSLYK